MVTETFTNKHEIKNPSPHYDCLQINYYLATCYFAQQQINPYLPAIFPVANYTPLFHHATNFNEINNYYYYYTYKYDQPIAI